MAILVTGGCGFIGSNFIRRHAQQTGEVIINLDALTYASSRESTRDTDQYFFVGDIGDKKIVNFILNEFHPRAIVNFAAESHVDNSINNAMPFVKTNVLGTVNLLDCALKFNKNMKFLHVSTDEVYGSLGADDPAFTETTPYSPRSPYSASKAASDHFVMAYHHTYGMNTNITNCSNNYGPYQHPEKFIPTVIRKALSGENVPVYGTGMNIRDWIHVNDHCDAIEAVLDRGIAGSKYNIGGETQMCNLELAKWIIDILKLSDSVIKMVDDRKGHDFRYDIDNTKINKELGWHPKVDFEVGLRETVRWYDNNMEWVRKCLKHSGLS